jgi:hypothetical protein
MLATSGRLDRRLFGTPVPVVADAVGQIIAPDDKPHRGVYLQVRRSKPVAFLTALNPPKYEMHTRCASRLKLILPSTHAIEYYWS